MTKVYYEVDGVPVPASECMWVLIAPCGCQCAWSVAEGYCHSEDEAWDNFSRTKAARRRDEKLGYRVEVKGRNDVRIGENCPHDPVWGVEPRPKPEGHSWATMPKTRVLHLVPLVIEKDSSSPYTSDSVATVCERASARIWSTSRFDIDGLVECTGCVNAAKERAV